MKPTNEQMITLMTLYNDLYGRQGYNLYNFKFEKNMKITQDTLADFKAARRGHYTRKGRIHSESENHLVFIGVQSYSDLHRNDKIILDCGDFRLVLKVLTGFCDI